MDPQYYPEQNPNADPQYYTEQSTDPHTQPEQNPYINPDPGRKKERKAYREKNKETLNEKSRIARMLKRAKNPEGVRSRRKNKKQ